MVWFVHVYFQIEVCTTACGFGRFDQYMWPYYKKDVIDEKNITQDEALEMLECFYLKACEVYEVRDKWYATSFAGYPMWEILVVAVKSAKLDSIKYFGNLGVCIEFFPLILLEY